jgi:hypothetical protein
MNRAERRAAARRAGRYAARIEAIDGDRLALALADLERDPDDDGECCPLCRALGIEVLDDGTIRDL